MAIKTAKELLASYNVLESDKKRHAHHEFQAFAYKLAHDLNDLEHLRIYMRLARNVERSLMERAYSYAYDARSDNKGKIFFWKIKELRKEYSDAINSENFEYEYVAKEMRVFRDELAPVVFSKTNIFGKEFFSAVENKKKKKILVVNCINEKLLKFLMENEFKITILEGSRKLKKVIQTKFKDEKLPKIVGTDFLKNRFKEKSFDYVLFNEYWLNIPVKSEEDFLKAAQNLLKEDGVLQLLSKQYDETQSWKKYKYKDKSYKYFIKENEKSPFEKKLNFSKSFEKEELPEGMLYRMSL